MVGRRTIESSKKHHHHFDDDVFVNAIKPSISLTEKYQIQLLKGSRKNLVLAQ